MRTPLDRPHLKHASVLAVLLVAAMLCGFFPALALASRWEPPPAAATLPVDVSPGDQNDPHISGTLIAYTSDRNGTSEIRAHTLITGASVVIPNDGNQDLLADISGDTIVFTRFFPSGYSSILRYDASTGGPVTDLASQPASARQNPAIGNQTVAWEDYGLVPGPLPVPELVAYDLSTNTVVRLTNDQLADVDPAVSADGSTIVWSKCQPNGTNCDNWQAIRSDSGWTATQLTGTEGNESSPDTNGQVVVYQSDSGGNFDVFWQPAGGGTQQQLALPAIQRNPNISGHLITFESQDATTGNFDVVLYDLATDKLYQLTNTPMLSEQLNDVSVAPDGLVRVVWSQLGPNGDFDLYTQSLRLPAADSTPPTITITSPTNVVYTLNQLVRANYSCVDADSAVTTCAGSASSGSPIDTASVGAKIFSVTAADNAGNTTSQTVAYTVAYDFCILLSLARDAEQGKPLPPTLVNELKNAVTNGTPIPILFHRCDRASRPQVLVTAQIDTQQTDVQRSIYVVHFTVGGLSYTVTFRVR